MGETMPDFSNLFYNIEGDLLSERKKNFRKLLEIPCFKQNSEQLHRALADLKPRTYLEGLFKVDALIHFKRTEELLEILKEGNEVYMSKLLKQTWFIKEVFGNMTSHEFVNKFLPTMSYSFKIKFIKKMCLIWDEAKHDELFDCIFDRYGLPLAKTNLHKCSEEKIHKTLELYEIKLTSNQEKHLFDRSENIFLDYILHHNESESLSKYHEPKVIGYIALKNPGFLLELKQQNAFVLHTLGRRTTKKIFNIVKEDVKNNVDAHQKLLKNSVMVRKLGKDFDAVFEKIFPKNFHEDFLFLKYSTPFRLLSLYPKKKKWQLFHRTYAKKFPDKDLSALLSVFDDYIIKLDADKTIIQKWAEIKYKDNNDEGYLPYYTDVPQAVTLIKEKINVTSDKSNRVRLVKLLIDSCKINGDPTTLEKVLAYIVKRHRNEDPSDRINILRSISSIHMEKLNDKHWQHIRTLVKIIKVQKDIHYYGCIGDIDQNYIEYLIKKKQPIGDPVREYLEEYDKGLHRIELFFSDPSIHSKFIDEVCKVFPRVVKSKNVSELFSYAIDFCTSKKNHALDLNKYPHLVEFMRKALKSEQIDKKNSQIIRQIFLYNVSCPEYAFSIDESFMLHFILEQIEKNYIYLPDLLNKIILKKERTAFENQVFKIFWENIEKHYDASIGEWFFLHDPKSVAPYFDKISFISASGRYGIISDNAAAAIKYYSHFGFDKNLCEEYKEKVDSLLNLEDEAINCADSIRRLITHLAHLLSNDDFLKLVLRCVPEKHKIDVEDPKMKELFALQTDFIRVLHKVVEPSKMLDPLVRFCVGDYLRYALQPLYSIMHRSPEEKIRPCIETLAKRSMSVRKHALSLNTLLLDQKTAVDTLKSAKSTDSSENSNIFQKTIKYFLKNPSKDMFSLCMTHLKIIDKNDVETLDMLIDISFPRSYKAEYLENLWTFFEDLKSKGVKIEKYVDSIMSAITLDGKVFTALSDRFIYKIIHDYFKFDNICNIRLFMLEILLTRMSDREKIFKEVFNVLKEVHYKVARNFVEELFEYVTRNKKVVEDETFLEMFYKYWSMKFPLEYGLQEHISLRIVVYYKNCATTELFAQNVVDYFEHILERYGALVLDIFKSGLDLILNALETIDKYKFYLNAMRYKPRPELCVLVIKSIENIDSKSEEDLLKVYNELNNILANVGDEICKIHYQYYLLKNSSITL